MSIKHLSAVQAVEDSAVVVVVADMVEAVVDMAEEVVDTVIIMLQTHWKGY